MVDVVDPEPLIKRQLAWDILPCAQTPGFLKRLGLIPGSDGGDDLEHHQSHKRINRILPIEDVVNLYGQLAGEVAGRAILDVQDHEIEDDEDPKLMHYRDTIRACVQAVIANLLEANVLYLAEDE